MQNLRGNQSALWGFENSQWEGGACAPVAPLPWDFFGRVQSRALESKIPPTYLHQKDSTLIKRVHLLRVFILLFCKICSLYLTVKPSASRSLLKCRLRGFKMQTLNSVRYLTNLRSTLVVTSRISCYEVAWSRLSESRAAEKIK